MNILQPWQFVIESEMPIHRNESEWQADHNKEWDPSKDMAWHWAGKERTLRIGPNNVTGLEWTPYIEDAQIFETREEAQSLLDRYTDTSSGAAVVAIKDSHYLSSWKMPGK